MRLIICDFSRAAGIRLAGIRLLAINRPPRPRILRKLDRHDPRIVIVVPACRIDGSDLMAPTAHPDRRLTYDDFLQFPEDDRPLSELFKPSV
jgi:hypothetical protein